jgi:Na+/phosphate symporter
MIPQRIDRVEQALEDAQYILSGQTQLGVKETRQLREAVNRAKNQLQAVKESYNKKGVV